MRTKPKNHTVQRVKSSPVYKQLADSIRERIQAGEFVEGERLPSTKQFSEEFKVNHLTTRQALKVLEQESLISMHAGRGTFVRSSKPKIAQIAVIVPSLGQQMPGEISRGMRQTIRNGEEASLTFIDYHDDVEFEKECLERLKTDGFDGAIYFPSLARKTIKPVLELVTAGFPVVFIDRAIEGVPCWLVSSDNFSMGRMAAAHLLKAGVKRPACLMTTFNNTLERLHGFRVELNNQNIALPEERVMMAPLSGDADGGLTAQLLDLKQPPDGIFYYNDYMALVGLKVIQQRGLKVPGGLRILGCDDIEAGRLSIPTLTSVHQNFRELGSRALEMLLELIGLPVEERFQSRHEVIGVNLVSRESTAKKSKQA